ncbi:MAG: DUF192 domain-containing protein [Dehalococcoidia bacterium]|nr:DUF192 domain-containing protein [Dehalococcoidia bacterium]
MAAFFVVLAACASDPDASPTPSPDTVAVVFQTASGEEAALQVELADTAELRSRGLMFRDSLPEDGGMLFDFGGQTQSGFWMKDTKVPLSIAFIDGAGTIIDIQDMAPLSEQLHYPAQPYNTAVEVTQGWFRRNGVAVGDTVVMPVYFATP